VSNSQVPTRYEFVVAESEAGSRLDHYLVARELRRSRSQLKRLIDRGLCSVNEAVARPAKCLRAGDRVALLIPPAEPDEALPEAIALCVLYEDPHLIVVDKPAGMVVHPAVGHRQGTLVNALLGHCRVLSGVGGTLRPGIVHRLDKLTSGVLVASKTDEAHLGLAAQFAKHSVERRYHAVVSGALPAAAGTFDTAYRRHPTDRKRFTSRGKEGRRAVTHYRVLEPLRGATLVEARLETGRTHQVRVHFADAGHPVLGDPMYGRPPRDPEARQQATRLARQALHAHALGFDHPITGERLRFATPMPPDMQQLMAALRQEGS
jgi:23S rRNA pseudouridine1911/1915/1917 synthase